MYTNKKTFSLSLFLDLTLFEVQLEMLQLPLLAWIKWELFGDRGSVATAAREPAETSVLHV